MLQKVHMKIYVASSWRCERQPAVVAALRVAGHEVYDFKNPAHGQSGFGWKQITDTPPPWSAAETLNVLSSPVADAGFKSDMDAMKWCDALVMVQPCGRSAAMELGWACGRKITVALLEDGQEPELMLKMADAIVTTVESAIDYLRIVAKISEHSEFATDPNRYALAARPHACEFDANESLRLYLEAVSLLREKHRVPEVAISVANYYAKGDEQLALCQVASFGDQRLAPDLAANLFGELVSPIIDRARHLEALAIGGKETAQ